MMLCFHLFCRQKMTARHKMKAKTNTLLIVVALLAYWVSLCNASAFYDPGAQRWLNRDPIAERGGKNIFEFVLNSPLFWFDAFGLDQGSLNSVLSVAQAGDCKGAKEAYQNAKETLTMGEKTRAQDAIAECDRQHPKSPPSAPDPKPDPKPDPMPPTPPPPQTPNLWNCPPFYYFWNGPTGTRNLFGPPHNQLPWFVLPPYRPPVSPPIWPTGLPPGIGLSAL